MGSCILHRCVRENITFRRQVVLMIRSMFDLSPKYNNGPLKIENELAFTQIVL